MSSSSSSSPSSSSSSVSSDSFFQREGETEALALLKTQESIFDEVPPRIAMQIIRWVKHGYDVRDLTVYNRASLLELQQEDHPGYQTFKDACQENPDLQTQVNTDVAKGVDKSDLLCYFSMKPFTKNRPFECKWEEYGDLTINVDAGLDLGDAVSDVLQQLRGVCLKNGALAEGEPTIEMTEGSCVVYYKTKDFYNERFWNCTLWLDMNDMAVIEENKPPFHEAYFTYELETSK